MRNTKDDFEEDERHFLYEEYLKILAEFLPPVFILENVPGLLSSKVQGADMFGRIRRDLEAPKRAVRRDGNGVTYSLHSLAVGPSAYDAAGRPQYDPRDFIVKSEDYGVPQRRHRVILFGLRSDLRVTPQQLTKMKSQISVADAIGDAPPLRSQVSRRAGKGRRDSDLTLVAERPRDLFGAGGRFVWYEGSPSDYAKRLRDARLGGFVGHEARRHMASDIERYEFAARFAFREGRSPKLADFPKDLLPEHGNVQAGVDGNMFADRFRVQLATEPGTTVTSHISKDGHYYIHYDFEQARSFTVREAARVQSFPDNYFFEGNRTQQYHQVGNAVPPLLAMQIAAVVRTTLARAGMVE
jgi:DNA (cytosine-5)-methyltransferase 1